MGELEKIRAEIEFLVKKLQKEAGTSYTEVDIGGVVVEWDGFEWSPSSTNDWYSSSMEC